MVQRLFSDTQPIDPERAEGFARDFETLFLDPSSPHRAAWERIVAPASRGKPVVGRYREVALAAPRAVLLVERLRPALSGFLRPDGAIDELGADWCIVAPGLEWAFICSHEARSVGQAYVEAYDPELELGRVPAEL